MTKCQVFIVFVFSAFVLSPVPSSNAQKSERTKVAEGEYRVTMEGDLGVGPIQKEIFSFSETWTLWRTAAGFDVEGHRTYESPRNKLHDDRFIAKLTPDLQLLSINEFAHLAYRRDSGPLSCELQTRVLRCDSGAKDPAQRVDVKVAMDRPYCVLWPLSAFSLASLTRAASTLEQPTVVQLVQFEQISERLPVLAIRSDGLLRYEGQSEVTLTVSGKSWHPKVYHLAAAPIGDMEIWTSQRGLLLAAQKPGWPGGRMELVKFEQFADF